MIWHIFKKDVRLHWHFAAGVAALGWISLMFLGRADRSEWESRMWGLTNLTMILQLVAGGILTATVVQSDAIPGVRQDWLNRPIERRDLLAATLIFVLALVVGPMFIGALMKAFLDGIPAGQALLGSIVASGCLLAAFYLPVLAFASMTRSFAENIVAIVAVLASLLALMQVLDLAWPNWRIINLTGVEWIGEFAALGVAGLGGAVVVVWQYFQRRLAAARWLTIVFGVLCVATEFIPWHSAFAIQQRLSPHPGGASAVKLEFQPSLGRYSQTSPANPGSYAFIPRKKATSVYLPIQIAGLDPETILRTDMMQVRLTGPDGRPRDLEPVIPPRVFNERPSSAGKPSHGLVRVPALLYEELRDKPVRLDLDYSLTLLRLASTQTLPALNGKESVPGFGHCETRIDNTGTEVQLHCKMIPDTPPCMTVFLENAASGRRNPESIACGGQYGPFNLQAGLDATRRAGFNLPFRDAAGLAQMPVDGSRLGESRVVLRFYEVVEHFTRHVAIPDVRLSEWLSL